MQAPEAELGDLEDAHPQRKKWRLTQEAFDKFLSCLAPDRDHAGIEYEKIRGRLVSFFECRDCRFAEDHADETINRVVRKIDQGETIRDPSTYVYGVARMLMLEIGRREQKRRAAHYELPRYHDAKQDLEASDLMMDCLKLCLDELAVEDQQLITRYYEGDKRSKIDSRKRLAQEVKIPNSSLRIRAHRLRQRLGSCLDKCVEVGRVTD